MAGTGQIFAIWRIGFGWAPSGSGQLMVPTAQSIFATNDFGANGGYVLVPGNGNPTGANIDTAITTIATNAQAYFDNGTPLGVIQGWQNGTG